MFKRFLVILPFVFCTFSILKAQQNNVEFFTNLEKKNSSDRVRYLTSYILQEVKGRHLDTLTRFLKESESLAQEWEDPLLLQYIAFFKQTKEAVLETDAHKRADFYRKKSEFYHSNELPEFFGICLHYLSQNQFVLEQFGRSFENSIKSQKIFEKIGLERVPNIGKYLHDLALNYYFFKDYRKVIQLMKKSISLPRFNQNLDIQRFNTLGMSYLELDQLDSAHFYFKKTVQKAKNYKNKVWVGIASGNQGEVALVKKDYKLALSYFKKSYRFNKNTFNALEVPREACTDLSKIYLALDSLEEAYHFNRLAAKYFPEHKNFSFGEKQQFERIKKQYYKNFYHYFLKTGDYKNALLYRDSLEVAKATTQSIYNKAQIKISQDKFRLQERKAEINKLKAQRRFEVSTRNRLIFLVLFLLLGTGGFLLYRNKRLMHKQKVKRLELENAQEELNHAQTRLTALTEKIKKNNVLIQKLQANKSPVNQEMLKALKESTILTKEDWKNFQTLFQRTYPGFLKNLRSHEQNLTPAEQRCLCLEKLQLDNDEMAAVLGVASNSVMVTKHRIRKKLHLEDQKKLEEFVQKI